MDILSKLGFAGGMLSQALLATGSAAASIFNFGRANYSSRFIHATKKGPGRSIGMKHKNNRPGEKIAKQAFNGMCTLRNGCGAAGRLAIGGKLGKKSD